MRLLKLIAPCYVIALKAILSKSKNRIQLKGGRFSAKGDFAYTAAIYLCNSVSAEKACEVRVFVPQKQGIEEGVQEQIAKVAGRLGVEYTLNKNRHTFTFKNGSRIICSGLYAKNSKNSELVKGGDTSLPGGIVLVILDELQTLDDFKLITNLEGTFVRQNPIFIEISNPPQNRRHPIVERYKLNEEDEKCLSINSTVYDVPSEWVEPSQWDYVNRLKDNNPILYRHTILGEMVAEEGLVIKYDDLKFVEVEKLQEIYFKKTFAVVDTKTTGTDFLVCAVIGITTSGERILRDVIFTDDILSEALHVKIANICNAYSMNVVFVEVNKEYSTYLELKKKVKGRVAHFTSTMNKHVKILTHAEDISRTIFIRTHDKEYNNFVDQLTSYDKKQENNKGIHDDAIDTMAMACKLQIEKANTLGLGG